MDTTFGGILILGIFLLAMESVHSVPRHCITYCSGIPMPDFLVCGTDGKTYSKCVFDCAQEYNPELRLKHHGECESNDSLPQHPKYLLDV